MVNIEIIKNKENWDCFLEEIGNYDFYHTFDYHHISKSTSDKAILIKYKKNDVLIGLPLLIREIEGSNYFDAISVYGYSGPISTDLSATFDSSHYKNCLTEYFLQNNIISVFVRLNPFIPFQNTILNNLGTLENLGKVVNIDLTIGLAEQRVKFHRSAKNQINKAKKLCSVKRAVTPEEINTFKDIYVNCMKGLNAKSHYFFEEDYYQKLNTTKDFETETLLVIENETGTAVAGSMFIKTKSIVQYHLSGANHEFLKLNPIKFLIDHARVKATEEGYTYFNLGGGLGGDPNDSLFKFKSSFSDDFHDFFVWKLVVNESIYKALCNENKPSVDTDFFPLYRYNETLN